MQSMHLKSHFFGGQRFFIGCRKNFNFPQNVTINFILHAANSSSKWFLSQRAHNVPCAHVSSTAAKILKGQVHHQYVEQKFHYLPSLLMYVVFLFI